MSVVSNPRGLTSATAGLASAARRLFGALLVRAIALPMVFTLATTLVAAGGLLQPGGVHRG